MTRILSILSLAALLTVPAAQVEARPNRAPAKPQLTKPQPSAAIKARQSAMADFDTRMSRLDSLMGVPSASSTRAVRARSAEAGR